ncbi:hypothetical protein ACQ4PT_018332 [Festuca glaucescens]
MGGAGAEIPPTQPPQTCFWAGKGCFAIRHSQGAPNPRGGGGASGGAGRTEETAIGASDPPASRTDASSVVLDASFQTQALNGACRRAGEQSRSIGGHVAVNACHVHAFLRLPAPICSTPAEPRGNARTATMHQHYYGELTPEQRASPHWDHENATTWNAFFCQGRLLELSRYDGNRAPPSNKNAAARRIWWGVPGRTLVAVLQHITDRNELRLEYPAPVRRWAPRRMASASSSSSSSRSSSRTSSASAPRTLRSGALYIGEAAPPLPTAGLRRPKREDDASGSSRLKKPKAEEAWMPPPEYQASQLRFAAGDDPEEFPGQRRPCWRRTTTSCRPPTILRLRGRAPR